jgi:hypothetical protein
VVAVLRGGGVMIRARKWPTYGVRKDGQHDYAVVFDWTGEVTGRFVSRREADREVRRNRAYWAHVDRFGPSA